MKQSKNTQPLTRRSFLKGTLATSAILTGGTNVLLSGCKSKGEQYDLIVKGGTVYDGLGSPGRKADVGIIGGKIISVGSNLNLKRARKIIDATGLAVSPGFIDPHSHSDTALLTNPKAESKIRQGVTTEINGNCGSCPVPLDPDSFEDPEEIRKMYGFLPEWKDFEGYCAQAERYGLALNSVMLIGHGKLRRFVMGNENRPLEPEEMNQMKSFLRQFMEQGAIGLSSGLEYAPGSYATTEELVELNAVAGEMNGIYATHMRNEDNRLIEAIEESIRVAKEGGTRLQISHLKACYPEAWGNIDAAIGLIERENAHDGYCIADTYPYTAGSTTMSIQFPGWAKEGTTDDFIARLTDPSNEDKLKEHIKGREKKFGTWKNLVISSVNSEKNKKFEGKNVEEASKMASQDPFYFMRDLMVQERCSVGTVNFFMSESNLRKKLRHPMIAISSDGVALAPHGILGEGIPHPRSYGTFPRVIGKYARNEKILSFEEAIRKMTSLTAKHFRLSGRGVVQEDYIADLVIFDPDKIIDTATHTDPEQYPEGIPHVIVQGIPVIEDGEHTGNLPGKMLKRTSNGDVV